MRQISELDDEDFDLLQRALTPGSDRDLTTPIATSPHLELAGGHLEVSVSEQLEGLLERLRQKERERVSVDSGAVSDMDSGSGTAADEEECVKVKREMGENSSGSSCSVSRDLETLQVNFRCSTEALSKSGPESSLREQTRNFTSVSDGNTFRSGSHHNSHRPTRKGVRETVRGEMAEGNSHRNESFTRSRGNTQGNRLSDHQRFRPSHAEIIEHTPRHNRRISDQPSLTAAGTMAARFRPPLSVPNQSGEVHPEQIETDEGADSSPTEGGPFITHWGKGRWKRNGAPAGYRDRGRRQYHQQFSSDPRPKFNSQGVNRMRYAPSSRGRFTGYNGARPERESLQNSHYKGPNKGSEYRYSGVCVEREQQGTGVAHQRQGKPLSAQDRERSPRQKAEYSAEPAKKEPLTNTEASAPVQCAKVETKSAGTAAPTQCSVEEQLVRPGSRPPEAQCEKSQPKRLSYASVTGSSGSSAALKSTTRKSPVPATNSSVNSSHKEQPSTTAVADSASGSVNNGTVHSSKGSGKPSSTDDSMTSTIQATTTTNSHVPPASTTEGPRVDHNRPTDTTMDHNKPSGGTVNHTRPNGATVDHNRRDATADQNQPSGATLGHNRPSMDHTISQNSIVDHTDSTVDHSRATSDHNRPSDATVDHIRPHTEPKGSTLDHTRPRDATVDQTRSSGATVDHNRSKDSTLDHTRPRGATVDHARPMDGGRGKSINRIIAASFNYSEAVDFLWRGEFVAEGIGILTISLSLSLSLSMQAGKRSC